MREESIANHYIVGRKEGRFCIANHSQGRIGGSIANHSWQGGCPLMIYSDALK